MTEATDAVRAAAAALRAAADALDRAAIATERPRQDPRLVSIVDAAAMLGISRTAMYALVRSGDVRTHKLGRRRLVSVVSLDELVGRD